VADLYVSVPMTLNDPKPGFKVRYNYKSNNLKTLRFRTSYYKTLIGNHAQSMEWCYFQ